MLCRRDKSVSLAFKSRDIRRLQVAKKKKNSICSSQCQADWMSNPTLTWTASHSRCAQVAHWEPLATAGQALCGTAGCDAAWGAVAEEKRALGPGQPAAGHEAQGQHSQNLPPGATAAWPPHAFPKAGCVSGTQAARPPVGAIPNHEARILAGTQAVCLMLSGNDIASPTQTMLAMRAHSLTHSVTQ